MEELVQEYLVECSEILDALDNDLLALERGESDAELLSRIFRGVHTVKGTSGFLGYNKLVDITHVGESLLDLLRTGAVEPSAALAAALLSLLDAMRRILAHVEADGTEGDDDFSALVATLQALQSGDAPPEPAEEPADTAPPAEEPGAAPPAADAAPDAPSAAAPPRPAAPPAGTGSPGPDETFAVLRWLHADAGGPIPIDQLAEERGVTEGTVRNHLTALNKAGLLVMHGDGTYEPAGAAPAPPAPPADEPGGVAEADESAEATPPAEAPSGAAPAPAPPAVPTPPAAPAPPAAPSEAPARVSAADSTIRVDVDLLDGLMNLVGELVLTRNQILQYANARDEAELLVPSQHLNLLTTELQEGVMKTRMQPIGNVWNKFPRIVRDLAVECEKEIQIEMEGADTELDKTIIEAIKDPLTHLVRNACDHGVERPAERVAAGKPAEGLLLLRAYHEGGQVNMEIVDDGGGIDPDKMKAKAVERGLISASAAEAMSAREALHLVFLPGFSTAQTVSNISGRGVGMDVVKTNIEKIGGTVDVHSRLGRGTTFRIKIPLTLAIIPALLVKAGGSRFAIPQVNLLELVRLEGGAVGAGIETIHDAPVYRLRGKLLPLVSLAEQLGLGPGLLAPAPPGDGEPGGDEPTPLNIVVLQADEQTFGLVVDEVVDSEEIVVKPLSTQLKALATYAGATIMGDGRVALILDVLGLAERARVLSEEAKGRVAAEADRARADDRESLLLARAGRHDRLALPLAAVSRLEEIAADRVERAGDEELVQYRGALMPLVRLLGADAASDPLQVVVCERGGAPVGLVVDAVVDIVEDAVEVQRRAAGAAGLAGVAVVQGRVTELVDVDHFVGKAAGAAVPSGDGAATAPLAPAFDLASL
ncbi:chemotaxis protein CheW [Rubrivirga sp. S365]|uniref:chemotaxis protein CheW n=1 Tax=Rubrivirga sp. S365 TaxID=3076080 RepID=UPI0028C78558|nr:chemotaxis protein CheW [Rubrivirga sp. S365]MDT7856046.1 chemotaxis protein CheW [Rubrivirga sp. S365]